MGVIIKNYVKNLKNEKAQYIFIGFPLIISMCVGLTLRGKMFEDYSDTRSRLFAIVCVAIWIGLFNSVLEICKERDILLIFDEVQCGIGRTGKLFGYQHFDINPDIVTIAKGLGAGLPIGGFLCNEKLSNVFKPYKYNNVCNISVHIRNDICLLY